MALLSGTVSNKQISNFCDREKNFLFDQTFIVKFFKADEPQVPKKLCIQDIS